MSIKIDLNEVAQATVKNFKALKIAAQKKQNPLPALNIKTMEQALNISGYMDKVQFIADSKIHIPDAKSAAEQLAIYQKSLQK